MRLLLTLGLALAGGLAAGSPDGAEAPPPRVDKALRGRVQQFYQAYVDAKFRQAEKYVAGDSKDYFYAAQKQRCYSFTIQEIAYSEKFQRASVTVLCDQDLAIPNIGMRSRVKGPQFSTWKQEKGKWVWYVDQNALRQTPYGAMKPPAPPQPGSAPPPVSVPTVAPSVRTLEHAVRCDTEEVRLDPKAPSSAEATISNHLPGWIRLRAQLPPVAGLEAKLEPEQVAAGQKARLTVRYTPPAAGGEPPKTTFVQVFVEPTGEPISVHIRFAEPAAGTVPRR